MSDSVIPVSTDTLDSKADFQLHSAGSMLRKAREAAGLHVAALAVSMKVPVKKLEALEADRLDLLPDMVFVRALASSVCRTLKIDPAPVLEKLPNTHKPQLVSAERDINTPFNAYGSSTALTLSSIFRKPVVLLVLLLLLTAGVVFFLPEFKKEMAVEEVVTVPPQVYPETAPPAVSVQQDGGVPLANTVGVPEGVVQSPSSPPVATTAAVAVQTPMQSASAAADAGAGVSTNLPVQVDKVIETAITKPAPGKGETLVLKASAPCWVKVVDANGSVLVLRVVAAGETIGVSGSTPLSVIIGAADAISVEVRGKPFSLVGVAKDNVARFEVK